MAVKRRQGSTQRWQRHCFGICVAVVAVPLLLVTLLLSVAVLRAVLLQPPQSHVLPVGHVVDMIDTSAASERAERLAGALRIKTVSYNPGNQEFQELVRMREYLQTSFPLVHGSSFITREVINEYSLLYKIQGTSENNATLPYLLASHFDVVPADPASWEEPPFAGNIVNGTYIYGRGAIDAKAGVMGIMEALEYILQKGERPKRTFYLVFGHDEEVYGAGGAKMLAQALRDRGVFKVDFLVDEGYPVTDGVIPGTDKLVAMIGVSEKGRMTLKMNTIGNPGHSSIPPAETSIGILAAAAARLEQNPLPSMFGTGPEGQMFSDLAPHSSFFYRLLYGNLWLFNGLMSTVLSRKPLTNAMVRSTTAITMFNGGVKENVISQSAEAIVNLRVHPSQTIAQITELVRDIVADPRVDIRLRSSLNANEAHPVSPSGVNDVPYQLISATLLQVYKDAVVVPATLIANTDTGFYLGFTSHVFRMYGFVSTPGDFARIHGNNERISIDNYHNSVNVYYRLMKNADLLVDHEPRIPEHRGTEL